MTTDDPKEDPRSINEVLADIAAQLQSLSMTDRRRLRLVTKLQVLEDRLACRIPSNFTPI
jgi:hypothetical protein